MDIGTIEHEYSVGRGMADLYLPNCRTFIEVKAVGKAEHPDVRQSRNKPESPAEQLDRYVKDEITQELRYSPLDEDSNRDWTGILTDGKHWHFQRYAHRLNPDRKGDRKTVVLPNSNSAPQLVMFLERCFEGKPVGREWIPKNPAPLFDPLKAEIERLYRDMPKRAKERAKTKHALWLDMLRASGMAPQTDADCERLFVTHSFLIAACRLIAADILVKGSGALLSPREAVKDGFAAWLTDSRACEMWLGRLADLVSTYDWRKRRTDVLRSVYQHFVGAGDRHTFGEAYTPDWLAEWLCEEIMDKEWMAASISQAKVAIDSDQPLKGVGLLDPACGSGTFLYHAALRLLDCSSMHGISHGRQADIVAALVNGLDIHPVAVEIARVTLLRALPGMPSCGESALRVRLGDALQANIEGGLTLFSHTDKELRLTTPGGREILIPMAFVRKSNFATSIRRLVEAAAERKPVPASILSGFDSVTQQALQQCRDVFQDAIVSEGNSVWAWYAINASAPKLLADRKVDRIVANPPWVRLSSIQVKERKRAMERMGAELHVYQGGKRAPHTDIASYFVLHARHLYMADPRSDPAAWLVMASAIKSGQWKRFREAHSGILAQSVDLTRLKPFTGAACCILMDHRPLCIADGSGAPLLEAHPVGRRPKPLDTWDASREKVRFSIPLPELPQAPSGYVGSFRNGATIFPSVLTRIASKSPGREDGWTEITTMASRHLPWKNIELPKGHVPTSWVRVLLSSSGIAPFIPDFRNIRAIIPAADGVLHSNPASVCAFWGELNKTYEDHRAIGKNTPQTLLDRIDHQKQLTAQLGQRFEGHRMVLYPASGQIMRAARIRCGSDVVVEHSIYWFAADSEAEAGYLVALMNAPCLRRAFSECRESERHFDLHPWDKVPIPRFDHQNANHMRMAELCVRAESLAKDALTSLRKTKPSAGQVKISEEIRKAMAASGCGPEMDAIAARLVPNQAD